MRRRRSFQIHQRRSVAGMVWSPVTTLSSGTLSTPFPSHNNSPMRGLVWEKYVAATAPPSNRSTKFDENTDFSPPGAKARCAATLRSDDGLSPVHGIAWGKYSTASNRSTLLCDDSPQRSPLAGKGRTQRRTFNYHLDDRSVLDSGAEGDDEDDSTKSRSISPLVISPTCQLARLPSIKSASSTRVSDLVRAPITHSDSDRRWVSWIAVSGVPSSVLMLEYGRTTSEKSAEPRLSLGYRAL